MGMNRIFKIAFIVCMLLCVLAIFVSPAVDLQPTALRALQQANLIFAMLGVIALVILSFESEPNGEFYETISPNDEIPPITSLIDLNCSRLR